MIAFLKALFLFFFFKQTNITFQLRQLVQVFPLVSFGDWIYVLPCKLFLVLEQLIQIFCRLLGFEKIFHDIVSQIHIETCSFSQLILSLDNEHTIVRREKLTKYRFSKKVLSPQAKFTWYFDLFHKHPCSFLIFEASILSELQRLHRIHWHLQSERKNYLTEGRIIMGAAVL